MPEIGQSPDTGPRPVEVPKEYNKSRYEMIQLVGQSAALRRLDLRHRPDVERMWDIEHSPGWEKYFDPKPNTDQTAFLEETRSSNPRRTWKEDLEWLKKKCDEREGIFYAIVKGAPSTKGGNCSPLPTETGELQGWVYLYESEITETERAKLKIDGATQPAYEITYIRLPNGEKGLMQSGVSQVLWDIARMNGTSDLKNNSEAVAPSVLVFGAIEEGNDPSVALAESIGFRQIGKGLVHSEKTRVVDGKEITIPYSSDLYLVDWEAHERGIKAMAEKILFPDATKTT